LLLSLIIIISLSSLINAACLPTEVLCPVDNTCSATGCVCGHSPNSALGYGQVLIGGFNLSIISCNNMADAVCPEDFTGSGGITANCSSCPDSECTANNSIDVGSVSGKVIDGNGKGIVGVLITGHPIKWDNAATLDRSAPLTNDRGEYSSKEFLSGKYYFSASKKGYDTQLIETTIVRGQIKTNLNFQLLNGTCYADCTTSQNRCSAACDGVTFNDTNTKCSFDPTSYNGVYVKDVCNNQLKDSIVKVGKYDESHTYFVKCCEGTPEKMLYIKAKPDVTTTGVNNLVKTEKIAKRYGYPVRVVVAYWSKN